MLQVGKFRDGVCEELTEELKRKLVLAWEAVNGVKVKKEMFFCGSINYIFTFDATLTQAAKVVSQKGNLVGEIQSDPELNEVLKADTLNTNTSATAESQCILANAIATALVEGSCVPTACADGFQLLTRADGPVCAASSVTGLSGRLTISHENPSSSLSVVELADSSILATFNTGVETDGLVTAPGSRYALFKSSVDKIVSFVDGGLWTEDHVVHLHEYKEAPALVQYNITGPAPNHVDVQGDQMAIWFDGDASISANSKVVVLKASDIESKSASPPMVEFDINMHGVARPVGDFLFASYRRSDEESTSSSPVLPDQVAVYHLHDGKYELDTILDETCPNLHGAASDSTHVVFGCTGHLLVATVNTASGEVKSVKLSYTADLDGMQIGFLVSHEHAGLFIGSASPRSSEDTHWFAVDVEQMKIELIAVTDVGYSECMMGYNDKHAVVLHNDGKVTVMAAELHGDHYDWDVKTVEISTVSVPTTATFHATPSGQTDDVFISNPVDKEVAVLNLQTLTVTHRITLDFVPSRVAWVGYQEAAEEEATKQPDEETPPTGSPPVGDNVKKNRLAVSGAGGVSLYNAADQTSVPLNVGSSSEQLLTSGGGRYIVQVVNGSAAGATEVRFIDSGVLAEGNADPSELDGYTFSGQLFNSAVAQHGKLVVFFGGSSGPFPAASVRLLEDSHIGAQAKDMPSYAFDEDMTGVAIPHGEYVLVIGSSNSASTHRTAATTEVVDANTVSLLSKNAGGTYEVSSRATAQCSNMRGVGQNSEHVVVGCSGGVVVVHNKDGVMTASPLLALPASSEEVQSVHYHASGMFLVCARVVGSSSYSWYTVDAGTQSVSSLPRIPLASDASVVATDVGYAGQHYIVLDSTGTLHTLTAMLHGDHFDWASESFDLNTAAGATEHSLAVSQNSYEVYVSVKSAKQVLIVDLNSMTRTSTIDLLFEPHAVAWTGIPGDAVHTVNESDECTGITNGERWGYTLLFTIVTSLLAGLVIFVVVPLVKMHQLTLQLLMGFAVGALLGDVFFHIIPIILGAHGHGGDDHEGHDHAEEEGPSQWRVNMMMTTVMLTLLAFYWIDWFARALLKGKSDHDFINELFMKMRKLRSAAVQREEEDQEDARGGGVVHRVCLSAQQRGHALVRCGRRTDEN
ncbi:hypothetical protein DIPPA_35897 [Diplonema papillatum]|nr:hypothetical protein DIPPA_35897 [Diplonema papillatum]